MVNKTFSLVNKYGVRIDLTLTEQSNLDGTKKLGFSVMMDNAIDTNDCSTLKLPTLQQLGNMVQWLGNNR